MEDSSLLVELDCLLDTRIGTILSIIGNDQERFNTILGTGYFDRICDKFPTISHDEFKKAYEKRDINTLKNSQVTKIVYFIKEFVFRTISNSITSPHQFKPKVIVNTYPYKLSKEDSNNILESIRITLNDLPEVELINIPLEKLTPAQVKQNYSIVIMYDYARWLDYHAGKNNFDKYLCPDVGLIAPAISFLDVEEKDLVSEEDPFDVCMKMAAPFIALALYPIDLFCMVSDLERLKKEKENITAKG